MVRRVTNTHAPSTKPCPNFSIVLFKNDQCWVGAATACNVVASGQTRRKALRNLQFLLFANWGMGWHRNLKKVSTRYRDMTGKSRLWTGHNYSKQPTWHRVGEKPRRPRAA
jgi:hypothetical protein